jgi:hypothetical protein
MNALEEEIKGALDALCRKLNRGKVSNYSASIGLFSSKEVNDEMTDEAMIDTVLGPTTKPDYFQECGLEHMLLGIRNCIDWKGDEAVYPNRKYHATADYSEDVEAVFLKLGNLFEDASGIKSFEIAEGHPFYPVFWEFAYLIKVPEKAYALVGSCSD